jgi:fibronectin type 3 domain-containing protein
LEPENAGGTAVTNYTIYRGVSSGGESILTTIGVNLSFVDSSVIRGSTYYYRVSAVNLVGEGAKSNETSAQVPPVPSAPFNLGAKVGDGFCALSWEAPSDPGLGGLTYHLFRDSQLIWNGSANSYNDTTVTNGITYHYTVAANNSIGWGANSSSVSFAPQGPPTAPHGLETKAGNNKVELNWVTPSYTGPGVLIYHLFRNGLVVWNGTSTAHNDTSLVNGHIYEYKVAAQNDIGWSTNSSSLSAMPLGVPSAPGNLQATIGIGYINLSWSPSPNDGGMQILNYTILRNPAPSPAIPWVINVSTGITWYNDTSVEAGTTYHYGIFASSHAGASQVSFLNLTAPANLLSAGDNFTLYLALAIFIVLALVAVAWIVIRKKP